MKSQIRAEQIMAEYSAGESYKTSLGLYEAVKTAERFYEGRQWEGLKVRTIRPITMNMLRRLVTYFIAMIISDDISNEIRPFLANETTEMQAKALSRSIDRVIERAKLKAKGRQALRDAAVDGDACLYFYWDADRKSGMEGVGGDIAAELVMNSNVIFGNPASADVQAQPYILIVRRRPVKEVRREAKKRGVPDWESITADGESEYKGESELSEQDLATEITRFWRGEDGRIRYCRACGKIMLIDEQQTGMTLYPIAYWSWIPRKNSCHGVRIMDELINTQIAINQIWTALSMHIQTAAMPKLVYKKSMFPDGWDPTPGKAIAVTGDPREAIVSQQGGVAMPTQVTQIVDLMISTARDFAGASDAALGNVKPDNTSAIIAVQKATSAPLEMQRMGFYQFVEDYIRILADMMRAYYGLRAVQVEDGGAPVMIDFSQMPLDTMDFNVEVGAASYWSELVQITNADNLLVKGIIQDPIEYLERVPDGLIKNKVELIKSLRQRAEMQQLPAMTAGQAGTMTQGV